MKIRYFIRKSCPILSASLISIATVGFLLIQNVYSNRITELETLISKMITNYYSAQTFSFRSNECIRHTDLLKNDIDIFVYLNANKDIVNRKQEFLLDRARTAVIWATNSSLRSEMIDQKEADKVFYGINKILSPEEIALLYKNYQQKAKDGINKFRKDILKNESELGTVKNVRNWLWYICFVFQSFGMLLAFAALLYKNEV